MMEPGSARELSPLADARVQAIRDAGRNDSGHRVSAENQEQQFNLRRLTGKATIAPEIWAAVLAA
jgi:hypothetical protein